MNLQDRLNSIKSHFEAKAAPEAINIMHRATEDLRSSGILEHVLKVGAKAPEFALPNTRDEIVRSTDLLRKGPLVVAFYRGVW
ncbi:redoxin domain-containing protein [Desulfomonile tiedjei]|nr:redoxin domain-containing protein [Desulfomonile tiedjei]